MPYVRCLFQVYTAFDRHLDSLGVYKLDTVGDAFVVVAGLEGFKSKEASGKEDMSNDGPPKEKKKSTVCGHTANVPWFTL